MSKKFMLLTLAVVSAALFAMPAMASAAENHVEGATGKAFSGTGPEGSLSSVGEPTIKCTSTAASGEFTSETTGKVTLTFETCSAMLPFGITVHCRTAAEGTGVIKLTNQVFHLITISNKPGILITPPFPTIICGEGISETKIEVLGNGVIGTVTSPACGASSASMGVKFASTESSQEHKVYTGTTYDLKSRTEKEGASEVTAGLNGTATLTFTDGVSRKLVCT